MEWSGRAPALPAADAGLGLHLKETPLPKTANTQIAVIGIDIGKNSFHVVGLNRRGAIVLRQPSRPRCGARAGALVCKVASLQSRSSGPLWSHTALSSRCSLEQDKTHRHAIPWGRDPP
jgi:hypothetical protein